VGRDKQVATAEQIDHGLVDPKTKGREFFRKTFTYGEGDPGWGRCPNGNPKPAWAGDFQVWEAASGGGKGPSFGSWKGEPKLPPCFSRELFRIGGTGVRETSGFGWENDG